MNDLVLSALGDRTAAEALAAGLPPREVWLALCAETDVPPERRYGVGRLEPARRRAEAAADRRSERRVRHAGVSSNMCSISA